jgi:hypothetical protein
VIVAHHGSHLAVKKAVNKEGEGPWDLPPVTAGAP